MNHDMEDKTWNHQQATLPQPWSILTYVNPNLCILKIKNFRWQETLNKVCVVYNCIILGCWEVTQFILPFIFFYLEWLYTKFSFLDCLKVPGSVIHSHLLIGWVVLWHKCWDGMDFLRKDKYWKNLTFWTIN